MLIFNLTIKPTIQEFKTMQEARKMQSELKHFKIKSSVIFINKKFVLISDLTYKKFKEKSDAQRFRNKIYKLNIKSYINSEALWFRSKSYAKKI